MGGLDGQPLAPERPTEPADQTGLARQSGLEARHAGDGVVAQANAPANAIRIPSIDEASPVLEAEGMRQKARLAREFSVIGQFHQSEDVPVVRHPEKQPWRLQNTGSAWTPCPARPPAAVAGWVPVHAYSFHCGAGSRPEVIRSGRHRPSPGSVDLAACRPRAGHSPVAWGDDLPHPGRPVLCWADERAGPLRGVARSSHSCSAHVETRP